MFNQIKMNLLKEFYYYYQSPLIMVSILINELIILGVFWFTAKAFVPNLEIFSGKAIDYFTFIVIGETALRIPAFFITVIGRNMKNAALEGTFDHHLLLSCSAQYSFMIGGISASLFEILKVILVLSLAATIFVIDVTFISLILAALMQIISIFIFTGLSLISVSVLLILKRGEAWIMKIVSIATILAGAYFPTTVLPYHLNNYLYYVSPFNLLLESTRKIIHQEMSYQDYLAANLALLGWAIMLFTLGYFLFSQALHFHKKSNQPFLYIS
ncbi:MAG: hypothetical protein A2381_05685 [Bdellovibrionales bacterium RIFOXYB1_FULL_37_110]|nr:MAG: hypothetical protein A2417_06300 [Bdellovibrionales bacterium RIFOXYC1_FULL_37_79]OFZ58543.1 MAG: hypothetical protein A2381_05685 [Bdellovibrionales bacterium RIFOXYB1_FULL_37_110]OFZ63763.1 MAG: hypothetical protein A2577_07435 [Bdellovibrionales bacterium RIFOXYD1_FULL_36_51]